MVEIGLVVEDTHRIYVFGQTAPLVDVEGFVVLQTLL